MSCLFPKATTFFTALERASFRKVFCDGVTCVHAISSAFVDLIRLSNRGSREIVGLKTSVAFIDSTNLTASTSES